MSKATTTAGIPNDARMAIAGRVFDPARAILIEPDGRHTRIRPQICLLLRYLAQNPNRFHSKEHLLSVLWPGRDVSDSSVTQAIADARGLLGEAGHQTIRTVPRRGYMLVLDDSAPSTLDKELQQSSAADVASPLSIAVLPFTDIDLGYGGNGLARGIAQELVNELARNANLRLVSHYSSFRFAGSALPPWEIGRQLNCRYLVDGRVRRDAAGVHLSVELVDGKTGRILWAEDRRVSIGEIEPLRERVVQRIAGSLHWKVREALRQRSGSRSPNSMDIYELTARASQVFLKLEPEPVREARRLLEHAIGTDPEFSGAWAQLAQINFLDARLRLSGDWTTERAPEFIAQAQRAVQLDAYDPQAYRVLSWGCSHLHQHESALAHAERAYELAPSSADMLFNLASAQLAMGQMDAAMASAQAAMDLVPIPPGWLLQAHAFVLWSCGRIREALRAAEDCLATMPGYWWARGSRMHALVELGRVDEARQEAALLLRRAPWLTNSETFFTRPIGNCAPALRARLLAASSVAGIPAPACDDAAN